MSVIDQVQETDKSEDSSQPVSKTAGQNFRRRVRRCFMNGKPCIFGDQNKFEQKPENGNTAPNAIKSVFVVMPFRPNLDTFYEWSLKSYLLKGLKIPEDQIKRADEFSNIGYVMCEKICRRVQEADLIVVDLSLNNSNVFYELGLSVGLNKTLLIVCDEQKYREKSEQFWHSLGIGFKDSRPLDKIIVKYPNVGYIDGSNQKIEERKTVVHLEPLKPELKIIPLLVPGGLPDEAVDDIQVTFEGALKAALGVAISNMKSAKNTLAGVADALKIFDEQIRNLWEDRTTDPYIFQKDNPTTPKSYEEVSAKINSAFTCIIDLAGEKAFSYFWLGYCHARGVNVIPIYRSVKEADSPKLPSKVEQNHKEEEDKSKAVDNQEKIKKRDHVLAFDIRALWYIDFRDIRVPKLADLLKGVLEELIARDVPRRERNIFWERLTREMKVHIFTGAVHHVELNREVVGDWDLRAVSELVNYLSSSDESVLPELEKPIYAPETIRLKQVSLSKPWDSTSLNNFIKNVRDQMAEKNCLIIASPDVNSLTEVSLAEVYGIPEKCYQGNNKEVDFPGQTIIAIKDTSEEPSKDEKVEEQKKNKIDPKSVLPYFSRNHAKIKKSHRGFLVGGNSVIQEKYNSQDEAETKSTDPFYVLAHLVIMKNTFSKEKLDTIIVLLNGVSGPGTFGLAEVLTGGNSEPKARAAETILKQINDLWTAESSKPDFKGIEGIIKVKIKPEASKTGEMFSDARSIEEWEIWKSSENQNIRMTNKNPRSILT